MDVCYSNYLLKKLKGPWVDFHQLVASFKFRWSYFYRFSPFEFAFCSGERFAGHLFLTICLRRCPWSAWRVFLRNLWLLLIMFGGSWFVCSWYRLVVWGSWPLSGFFYIQGKQKLSLRSRETIQESFSYGETRSLRAFIRSIFLTTFLVEAWVPFY